MTSRALEVGRGRPAAGDKPRTRHRAGHMGGDRRISGTSRSPTSTSVGQRISPAARRRRLEAPPAHPSSLLHSYDRSTTRAPTRARRGRPPRPSVRPSTAHAETDLRGRLNSPPSNAASSSAGRLRRAALAGSRDAITTRRSHEVGRHRARARRGPSEQRPRSGPSSTASTSPTYEKTSARGGAPRAAQVGATPGAPPPRAREPRPPHAAVGDPACRRRTVPPPHDE